MLQHISGSYEISNTDRLTTGIEVMSHLQTVARIDSRYANEAAVLYRSSRREVPLGDDEGIFIGSFEPYSLYGCDVFGLFRIDKDQIPAMKGQLPFEGEPKKEHDQYPSMMRLGSGVGDIATHEEVTVIVPTWTDNEEIDPRGYDQAHAEARLLEEAIRESLTRNPSVLFAKTIANAEEQARFPHPDLVRG